MKLSREKKGELYIFSAIFTWSLFPIATIYLYQFLNPIFTLLLGSFFAMIFFFCLIIYQKTWNEFKNKEGIWSIAIATLFLITFYVFIFLGMQYTTAGNTGIILLMEIFFSFLYFGIWHKEKFDLTHLGGVLIMAIGAIIILFPGEIHFNKGDFLILIGTTFPPIANHLQQKSRKKISTQTLMFVRYLISLPLLFCLALFFQETIPSLIEIKLALPLLLFSGIVLFGLSKMFWIEGIHRISITKAISLETIAPAITLIFAYFLLNEIPTIWQISGFLPIAIGAVLITRK